MAGGRGEDGARITPQNITIPLVMGAAIAVVLVVSTWGVASYVNTLEARVESVESAVLEVGERQEEFELELDAVQINMLRRGLVDLEIRAAIETLEFPADYTVDAHPRPRVDAVRRHLASPEFAPMVTRDSVDYVWLGLTLRTRRDLTTPGRDRRRPAGG